MKYYRALTGSTGSIGRNLKSDCILTREMLSNEDSINAAILKFRPTSLLHLAAPTKTHDNVTRDTFRTGILELTGQLFKSFAGSGGTLFIYASTSHVYGYVESTKLLSEADAPNPSSDYAKWKLESEYLLQELNTDFNIQVVVLRIFSVFGKGMAEHFLAGRLEKENRFGKFSHIRNSLDIRDFSSPTEIANHIEMIEKHSHGLHNFEVVNLCSSVSSSIKEKVLEVYPKFPDSHFILDNSSLPFLVGDNSKLSSIYGGKES